MNRFKETFFILLAFSFHLANAQTFTVLPEYKGWFVGVEKDSSGEIVSAKVKVPKLEIVQADSIIWISTAADSTQKFGWITDSIVWAATDTTFEGDCKCEHDWLIGSVYPLAIRSVDVIYMKSNFVLVCASGYHPRNSMRFLGSKYPSHEPEEHCPFEVNEREKICRKCLRSVIEREKWFQRFIAPPKSEFEILKEKQRAKR